MGMQASFSFNQGTANNDMSVWHYYQGKDINIFESFL